MTIREVLHALVNQLPHDWDREAMHAAVDEHLEPTAKAGAPAKKNATE